MSKTFIDLSIYLVIYACAFGLQSYMYAPQEGAVRGVANALGTTEIM